MRTRASPRLFRRAGPVALLGVALAGCGGGVDGPPQAARPAEEMHRDFGNVELHYNAVRTDQLTPAVARAYDIERSGNRVLLNVSVLEKSADGRTTPVDGTVTARARNLNGQLKDLEMRRVQEGRSIYFLGEVGISGSEILVFDIEATPRESGTRHAVTFKREFFAD